MARIKSGTVAKARYCERCGLGLAFAQTECPRCRFDVIVGNIGMVCHDSPGGEADAVFGEYVSQSRSGVGRAGGESVTLWCNGEIVREHVGAVDLGDSFAE